MDNNNNIKISSDNNELLSLLTELRQQQADLRKQLIGEEKQLNEIAQRLWLQQEHERAQLSRELHDGLGQVLTSLKTQLQHLNTNEPLRESLIETATLAVDSARDIARMLHPTILSDLGLGAAVSWLARQLLEPAGIQHQVNVELKQRLSKDLELFVFRLLQEICVNTVKHAHAKTMQVIIQQQSGGIQMVVADDGIGFEVSAQSGLGLHSLADRCRAFGAELDMRSAPEQGTEYYIRIPGEGHSV